jgi:ABC-type sugar transport system ATPase subunit
MNLFEGEIRGGEHDLRFIHPEFTFSLPERWRARVAGRASSAVTLGIRPENLSALSRPDAEGKHAIRSVAETIERIGAQVFVHFSVNGQNCAAVVAGGRAVPEPGEALAFQIDPEAVRFFDAATGLAL